MNSNMKANVSAALAAILFLIAAIAIVSTQQPLLIKIVIGLVAYFIALHWLHDYSPRTARLIGKYSVLFLFEMIRAVLSVGVRRR